MIDLHTHTHFSDGTYSPAELIADIQACAAREDAPADNTVTERSDPT
jgi:predicted metal-dependent phosphoesterase TrpH